MRKDFVPCAPGVIVLEERLGQDFQPTAEEIRQYGEYLGLTANEVRDSELQHVISDGLKAPLPGGWKACMNAEGKIFYFDFRSGRSYWEHPADADLVRRVEEKAVQKGMLIQPRKMREASSSSSSSSSSSAVHPSTHANLDDAALDVDVVEVDGVQGVQRRRPPANSVSSTVSSLSSSSTAAPSSSVSFSFSSLGSPNTEQLLLGRAARSGGRPVLRFRLRCWRRWPCCPRRRRSPSPPLLPR
mmetsp:Transcript_37281/g.81070  ORF Transcript_37281/g.81070 Transcript_37281/m.81070 type:complete len:243 (-) Transcript_37281:104-832(-)